MKSPSAALFIVASLAAHVVAQRPSVPSQATKGSSGSGRIRGRVVAAATGRPLLLATVTLSGGNPYVRACHEERFERRLRICEPSGGAVFVCRIANRLSRAEFRSTEPARTIQVARACRRRAPRWSGLSVASRRGHHRCHHGRGRGSVGGRLRRSDARAVRAQRTLLQSVRARRRCQSRPMTKDATACMDSARGRTW